MPIRMTRSTGNVFEDVGFPPEEAAHLLIRSDLMMRVCETIEERGLSVREAAATLRVTQRRVRELVRGRIELFSIDTLIGMLFCLDVSVSAKVGRRPRRIVRTAAASRAAFVRVMVKVRHRPPIPGLTSWTDPQSTGRTPGRYGQVTCNVRLSHYAEWITGVIAARQ